MKKIFKGKAGTAVILVFTLILAGIAIFTAVRLYQLRQQPVAPNVPSSIPKAQEATPTPNPACSISFTIGSTPTATTPTVDVNCDTKTGTITADVNWVEIEQDTNTYYVDVNNASASSWLAGSGNWWHKLISSPTTLTATIPTGFTAANGTIAMPALTENTTYFVRVLYRVTDIYSNVISFNTSTCSIQTSSPTPTATPNPSGTPNTCGGTCGSNSNCVSDKICYQGFCRNPACVTSQNCVCAPTSPPGSTPTGTPTATPPTLPQSGTSWPTILGAGMGTLIILGAILLAL